MKVVHAVEPKHRCALPRAAFHTGVRGLGTVVQCEECGRKWTLHADGWWPRLLPAERRRVDRAAIVLFVSALIMCISVWSTWAGSFGLGWFVTIPLLSGVFFGSIIAGSLPSPMRRPE